MVRPLRILFLFTFLLTAIAIAFALETWNSKLFDTKSLLPHKLPAIIALEVRLGEQTVSTQGQKILKVSLASHRLLRGKLAHAPSESAGESKGQKPANGLASLAVTS
jgi:hypothetical protein